jgi:hypothetical protein
MPLNKPNLDGLTFLDAHFSVLGNVKQWFAENHACLKCDEKVYDPTRTDLIRLVKENVTATGVDNEA